MQCTPSPREDGRAAATARFLPPEPSVRSTPSPRQNGRVAATVVICHRNWVCKALLFPVKTVALLPP